MIIGNKIILRPLRISDAHVTQKWHNDMSIKFLTMSHPFPVTEELETDWISKLLRSTDNKKVFFSIDCKESGEMVGYIFLHKFDYISRHCEWGGLIGNIQNQQKGYGSEAVMLILNYAFGNLNMNKVYAHVIANHHAMNKWLSIGAQIEGTLKGHYWHGDKYHDINLLAWYPNCREIIRVTDSSHAKG